jgi:GT2 family glycosyltransferase
LHDTTQVLDERTRAWHETTHELNETLRALHTTRETLSEREQVLGERTRELHTTRETLSEREQDITGLSSELATTEEKLAERDAQVEEQAAELGATRETLSDRDSEIARLAMQLHEIRASTSWRLTIPVRYVGTIVKRAARLARFVLFALRTPRSGLEALRRLLAALRQGGMTEVRNKLRLLLEAGEGSTQFVVSPEDRRAEFAPPSVESEPDVFVLAIIDWDFRFQRSQHLAVELARAGRRVFYVEMLLEPSGLTVTKLDTNLYRVRLPAGDIGYIQPYTGQATPEQRMAWFEAFLLLCDAVAATSFKQIIIQHPFWWQMTRSIPPEFHLFYDCMDDIAGFSNTDRFVLDLEDGMVESCDALIVTSEALFEKYHGVRLPRLIRNAANVEHFSSGGGNRLAKFRQNLSSLHLRNADAESAEGSLINVGYVGAIADWFDAELVRSVAASGPDFRIHLCGAVSSRKVNRVLEDAENVFFYGEIPYVDVPAFLERMDVLVIPFRIIPIIESCDPVKFYEYSAVGKPTVATRLPELERASDLVFFASTPDEFSKQIRNACEKGRDPDFQDRLKNYASQNTWTQRCDELVDVLRDLPLVSVVILSFGDPELTKAAMHSLFDGGPTYPRMEVLVVDNGSPSSNLAEIKALAAGYPDVEVIENGSNLGFARGNNVGLERATGEYVLLLNNDTFVAPGAVHAMVRHLRDNPEIGAVGPLTNNIGNEAKVFVRYGDMDQMKKTVRRMTLGYRGRFLAVGALGYFAVMFRRKELESFGLLPLDYGLGMFEDDDHCRTIQSKGYVTAVAEDGFVHHHLSASFDRMDGSDKKALFESNREIFERKWGPWKAHQYRRSRPEKRL